MIYYLQSFTQSLSQNVEVIKTLIKQAESLSQLAQKVSPGRTKKNIELKKELTQESEAIKNTVSLLIEQTTELSKQYEKLLKDLFDRK